ncbi:MAG: hypothetical protein GX774_01845 [Armatimonadetes bacterium]|nr:hypothetical protein [Armatimonadota bacterium]
MATLCFDHLCVGGMALTALAILLLGLAAPAEPAVWPAPRYLEFDRQQEWAFSAQGAYLARLDRRGLYVVTHPRQPAGTGDFGRLERTVTLPRGWKPPFALHLYCSDDYVADGWRPQPGDWLGSEAYVGHRFKQVLVDDQVVWERDVADDNAERAIHIDLTPHVTPGKPFRLALRVIDRVGTDQVLPEDFLHIGTTDATKPGDPRRFQTQVWWGDVALTQQDRSATALPPRPRPSAAAVEKRHARRWPLPPLHGEWNGPIELALEAPGGTPASGWPTTCGVPFPPGRLRDVGRLRLVDARGAAVPLQAEAMNTWPDGSLRWVRLDALLHADRGPYRLEFRAGSAPAPDQPVRVEIAGRSATLNTGALSLRLGGDPHCLIDTVALPGSAGPVAEGITARLQVEQEGQTRSFRARTEVLEVLSRGPIRATVALRGQIVPEEPGPAPLGRFVFRLDAYAGHSAVRATFRLFNDTAETLRISDLSLVVPLAGGGARRVAWKPDGAPVPLGGGPVVLQHSTADAFAVTREAETLETGAAAPGWLACGDGRATVAAAVRHFRQLWPKALVAREDALAIRLFAPTEQEPYFTPTPGEAKRHELLLDFTAGALEPGAVGQRLAAFLDPPRLFSPAYFCASGGLGAAHPHGDARFAPLRHFIEKTYAGDLAKRLQIETGIRHFGDKLYNADQRFFHNNYYDMMMGAFGEYLMSGDRRWFDFAEATARHVMDIDQIHSHPKHPEWLGAVHAYNGKDHTGTGYWNAMLRQGGGFATYWRLTGDSDAREALLMLADFIVRSGAGVGSGSVRDHAGVFITLVWAYDETRNPRYAEMCRKLVIDLRNRIEPRRGGYPKIHGNWNYRGNVPWMDAQLMEPLYLYYRQIGDLEAAHLVVGLAESLISENMTPGVPGDFYGYSHNPHFKKTSGYHVLLAPALFYAYDLTGDREFLECAVGAYEQTVREGTVNAVYNCYWNVPTLLHFLNATGYAPPPGEAQETPGGD